ncbi:GyrI-like domain-containing protein (plasmid) [Chondrinema litorale]|nr:GyrI-like domain-containing protein [Chondrinema litorale]UZR96742.1 GyrI-like domain-containing protein [Chondrinema litorale]
MKHEWRKAEKGFYLPKNKPEVIEIPEFNFVTIEGEGNPNNENFSEYISALYAISYTIKMNLKKDENKPVGYSDYTVYPLEGVWDINDEAKANYNGTLDKDTLVFKIMIRQPDFVEANYFNKMLELALEKKANPLLKQVKFEKITEGRCIQMLHIGSYDDEPASFERMEKFAESENLKRQSKIHREIYLSDFRKVPAEKLKTILRFKV